MPYPPSARFGIGSHLIGEDWCYGAALILNYRETFQGIGKNRI
jgi:hypothetical protein